MQWGSSRCETVRTCNLVRNCRWCRMHPVAWLWVGRRRGPGEFNHVTAKNQSKLNGIEYSFGFRHYSLNMVDCLYYLLLFIDSRSFHRIIKTPWTSSQWGAWYEILANWHFLAQKHVVWAIKRDNRSNGSTPVDVVTCAKFWAEILRGYGFTGGRISDFFLILAWALQECSSDGRSVLMQFPDTNVALASCMTVLPALRFWRRLQKSNVSTYRYFVFRASHVCWWMRMIAMMTLCWYVRRRMCRRLGLVVPVYTSQRLPRLRCHLLSDVRKLPQTGK